MIVKQMNSGFDHRVAYFGSKKEKKSTGLAGALGITSEELASIIKHGGCDNDKFRVKVSHAEAVLTSHDNPFM